ncbi:CPBP family intramembrane metalloprotease (plasmid) [Bacillus sp. JAS24-2]|uniref:CPBP family intramembrane glutamic endopeptidase n=1 Tax=Bacillus sp. JAS24-2 TaxID=2217832 RepID=UPI0011ED0B58|nr:CPBP family intramembrane glutamic endopeptidase [Bacillus sp. JAS24-2]QEL82871.1 CPBP family intramembrane metalloprotease [Bacillus sp. JAS24-2]
MKNSKVYNATCVILIYLLTTQFLEIIGVKLLAKTGWYDIKGNLDEETPQILVHCEVIGFIFLLGMILFVYKKEWKRDEKLSVYIPKGTRSWIVKGIILVFLAQIIGSLLDKSLFRTPLVSENTSNIIGLVEVSPIAILSIVILAPLVEEFVFRYAVLNILTKKLDTIGSIIISALIYSISHFDFPFVFGYFLIGAVLAFVYVKSNRLLVSFMVHAGMNLFVVMIQMI